MPFGTCNEQGTHVRIFRHAQDQTRTQTHGVAAATSACARARLARRGRWARGVGVLAGVLGAARAQGVRGRQPSEGAAAWGEAGVVVERRAGL